ncbi:MAG: transporter, partial [Frankiales bacterium]|nr:transporter [Frankiales bacterium]
PGSSYPAVLACLLLFAGGNGLSFVPLTQAALEGVPPQDAGAASGLVNVTQQLGGTLGVAVLVTVFGHFSRNAKQVPGASALVQGHQAFTAGSSHAFAVAMVFLLAAFVLVAVGVRAPRMTAASQGR